jgi:hypothetical protein
MAASVANLDIYQGLSVRRRQMKSSGPQATFASISQPSRSTKTKCMVSVGPRCNLAASSSATIRRLSSSRVIFLFPCCGIFFARFLKIDEPGAYGLREPIVSRDLLAYVVSLNLKRRIWTSRKGRSDRIATLPKGANQHAIIQANSQSDAAEMLNVGRRSVQYAREVLDEGIPELGAAEAQNGAAKKL